VIEGILAVVAGDGQESCGAEALVERVGEGVANPCEIGLAGTIVEGKNQDEASAGVECLCG
jgi:hypothetical protein